MSKPMRLLWNDQKHLPALFGEVAELASEFLNGISERPLKVPESSYPVGSELPDQGAGAQAALSVYRSEIEPYLSSSVGPRYFGFVTGGTTPAALLGDWVTSVVDQNAASRGDSISAKIEEQVINQLLELFALPETFSGSLTTGATVSNLLGLLLGRQFVGHQQGINVAKQGMVGLDAQVFSATPHASTVKAMGFAGFGQQHITQVDCLPDTEAMDVSNLEDCLRNSKARGKIVVASAGTVSANDFDDLTAIAELCHKHQAWMHVDAAFGLFASLIPEKKPWLQGIEYADSICSDCHKWLNVPYESGIFLTRHMNLLKETASVSAPYLKTNSVYNNYSELGLENSRRFRALPIWFTLQAYGRVGYRNIVEANCQQAQQLGNWIKSSEQYELLSPVKLNVVLFRAKPQNQSDDANAFNQQLLAAINESAAVLLTPGYWQGKSAIRAAFSNWRTQDQDLEILIATLEMVCRK